MRCSSTAGFHGRSRLMTMLPACKFNPTPPASVDRNILHSGSSKNRSTSIPRFLDGTSPVSFTHPILDFSSTGSVKANMVDHWLKMIALRPFPTISSARISRSSRSLGEVFSRSFGLISGSCNARALQMRRILTRKPRSNWCSSGVRGRRFACAINLATLCSYSL